MKAWAIEEYGDNSVVKLMELPEPQMNDDEVLIGVRAASINPVDYKTRSGMLQAVTRYKMPLIMGHDCAGVIVKKGTKVDRFEIGDEVYSQHGTEKPGTLAEFVAAKAEYVARKPNNITFEEAASLPLVGLTSWQALFDQARLKKGDRVFIPAGSGGVGSFAVQLARHSGAYVISSTSAKNIELVKSLGADEVFDYERQNVSDLKPDINIVFDTIGGETQSKALGLLVPGGTLVSITGPPTPEFMREAKLNVGLQLVAALLSLVPLVRTAMAKTHYKFLFMVPDGAVLEKIARLVEEGAIRPVVDKVYPFTRANEAIGHVEAGHARGKVVVTLNDDYQERMASMLPD
jgi:NADPH:quinone reductase-like Zn-dependent oxidoreductase